MEDRSGCDKGQSYAGYQADTDFISIQHSVGVGKIGGIIARFRWWNGRW